MSEDTTGQIGQKNQQVVKWLISSSGFHQTKETAKKNKKTFRLQLHWWSDKKTHTAEEETSFRTKKHEVLSQPCKLDVDCKDLFTVSMWGNSLIAYLKKVLTELAL